MLKNVISGAAALVVAASLAGDARASFIFGIQADGSVYRIATTSGDIPITERVTLWSAATTPAARNALGRDGSDLYSWSGDTGLYLGNERQGTFTNRTVWGADVYRGVYYGIDTNNDFFRVDLSENELTNIVRLGNPPVTGNLGDIAIRNGIAHVSVNPANMFTMDLDGTVLQTFTAPQRYAGLAWAGGTLFGVTGSAEDNFTSTLYALSFGNGAVGETFIANLTGFNFFDATSFVPLPAAAWLLLTALAGFFGYQRVAGRAAGEPSPSTA